MRDIQNPRLEAGGLVQSTAVVLGFNNETQFHGLAKTCGFEHGAGVVPIARMPWGAYTATL